MVFEEAIRHSMGAPCNLLLVTWVNVTSLLAQRPPFNARWKFASCKPRDKVFEPNQIESLPIPFPFRENRRATTIAQHLFALSHLSPESWILGPWVWVWLLLSPFPLPLSPKHLCFCTHSSNCFVCAHLRDYRIVKSFVCAHLAKTRGEGRAALAGQSKGPDMSGPYSS